LPILKTADFDFELPPELIAQQPATRREESRLLVLDRVSGNLRHQQFTELLDYLRPGDLLVLNDTKVIPARLRGRNEKTGGQFELLLLEENATNDWWAMVRPGKRARVGTRIGLLTPEGDPADEHVLVSAVNDEGHRRLLFPGPGDILDRLEDLGEVPLPPYIERPAGIDAQDRERYQTVFAQVPGSVAAPTAGLHFTGPMLDRIRQQGIRTGFVTLHVGPGTFAPVKSDTIAGHTMHAERLEISSETLRQIAETKGSGNRVIAVGTTSLRALESWGIAARDTAGPFSCKTQIFIYPPYRFSVVDALLTNFHLPRSTLLMLVSAFASPGETLGRELVLRAYAEAIRMRYRFFSYGDAMLII
jgi:S-adenosylmethionine:tRNA ribosyltransferase-isomerase